jgi:carbon monoxide dehydrogenase subunit G
VIETAQTVIVNAGIKSVWEHAHDINQWACLMPGLQSCNVVDADNSHWTLKVGAGGFVRTVKVRVHVTEWAGPERATFTFKLEGDPVEGGGAYGASSKGPNSTEITLKVRVAGSGTMAPMWEAMSKPLLPTIARSFAEKLKQQIEEAVGAAPQRVNSRSIVATIWGRLLDLWRAAFGPAAP